MTSRPDEPDDYVARLRQEWADRLPGLDTSAVDVMARIGRIAALMARRHGDGLAGHGLGHAELELLAALRRADRPLRAGQVSTLTHAAGATLTQRLDRLERAGHVSRTVAEHDRRVVLVGLTGSGRDLVDRAFPEQVDRERDALAGLSAAERDELAGLLQRVLARLEPSPGTL